MQQSHITTAIKLCNKLGRNARCLSISVFVNYCVDGSTQLSPKESQGSLSRKFHFISEI